MNTTHHIALSRAIQRAVENELDIKLNTSGFILGNIKPDIYPNLKSMKHLKGHSMDYVNSQIKILLNKKIRSNKKCSKAYSERLGVILHFLCDYFCFPHTTHFEGNTWTHMVYELGLGRYYRRNFKDNIDLNHLWYEKYEEDIQSCDQMINRLHECYSNKNHSMSKDISYSFNVCVAVSCMIITACMEKSLYKAA